jgi:hypothetical protein
VTGVPVELHFDVDLNDSSTRAFGERAMVFIRASN